MFGLFKSKKDKAADDLKDAMRKIAQASFPGGEAQVAAETKKLHALLGNRLTMDETRKLLCGTKALMVVAEDKSADRIVPSIQTRSEGKLGSIEAKLVYRFLMNLKFGGGDGSTRDKAIVINATDSVTGIAAEYEWLESNIGKKDRDWTLNLRSHGDYGGRYIETYSIVLANGTERAVHFDITAFFGKF